MTIYLGQENAGTAAYSLQDLLPTPITFLRESHAIESAALILGLAVVWLVLMRGTYRTQSAPKVARYFGIALAVAILATAHWLASQFRWDLATYLGEPLMAQLSPLKQYSTAWYKLADLTNFFYYLMVAGLAFLIWRQRETLGKGVLRITTILKSANDKV